MGMGSLGIFEGSSGLLVVNRSHLSSIMPCRGLDPGYF